MTLNQLQNRVKAIVLAHKQVRRFHTGLGTDFLIDKKDKYPAVSLQGNSGDISLSGAATTFTYKMLFVDLVHVAQDTATNEMDVQSDMVSMAIDVLSQMAHPIYNDWKISLSNSLQLLYEEDGDMYAGCSIDLSISVIYKRNTCEIPSDLIIVDPTNNDDMKLVYDLKYTATGNEGGTLTISEIAGKKILFITRESAPIYKVSSNPDPAEYTWNDAVIGLGTVTNPGERFLILYRNY